MKEKNNSPQARRNRNNRKRGASFEKKVADALDMEVVPYSGTNARFGWSDVRDSESKDQAWWMGECKNMSVTDDIYVIKHDWIEKMEQRAYAIGALPFLAFMRAGRPQKFILLNHRAWSVFEAIIGQHLGITRTITYPKVSRESVNLRIPQGDLTIAIAFAHNVIKVRLGDGPWYYITSIDSFEWLLRRTNMHYKWANGGDNHENITT